MGDRDQPSGRPAITSGNDDRVAHRDHSLMAVSHARSPYLNGHAIGGDANPGQVALPVSRWEGLYRVAVLISDLLVISAVSLSGARLTAGAPLSISAAAMAVMTALTVAMALMISRAWEPRVLGQGTEEFRRLGRGIVGAGLLVALVALAANEQDLRPWVFGVVPAVLVFAAPMRYVLRRVLHRQRAIGRCMLPVLAAGSVEEIADLVVRTEREQHNGWRIEAACTPGGLGEDGSGEVAGVPVVGDLEDLAERVVQGGYRVVAVVPDPRWTRRRLQQLAWQLENTAVDVVVSPVLMEVTGLLVLGPVLAGIAGVIWMHDRGPVFYRQTRVGRDGTLFTMIKFRSMVIDADRRRRELVQVNEAAGPLFKLRSDPRITRVGVFLRRYSLDELPQLFNVLAGSMSLVGPRPPLPNEVANYDSQVRRRLLVKPGLTGLWQISGRSDLPWDEAVRLDLRYVENWSLALDLLILWRTGRAVLHRSGAY